MIYNPTTKEGWHQPMRNFIELIETNLSHAKGLKFIEQMIIFFLNSIAKTQQIGEADLLFKNLEDIQIVLAKAVFKNGIIVTPFLRDFIRDYDRIDDVNVKENLYQRIKSETTTVSIFSNGNEK